MVKFQSKIIKRGYTHWLTIKKDIIDRLGYEDGDEVEVDIRRKLVSRKQRKESNTA
jgi:antitoxin component of MazEF toxin-antitoxin module